MRANQLAASLGVARQTVAAWEDGQQIPSTENLQALAEALDYPMQFFTSPDIDHVPAGAVSFRAGSKMTATTRDVALAAGRTALLVSEWITGRYQVPAPDVPTLGLQPAEQAAEVVRTRWGLGEAPVGNMTHLLESRGVRIFSLPRECQTVDAFSLRWIDTPLILLTASKSAERRRFDLAHELGHLVLHAEEEHFQGPKAEAEANRFASAFLMPRRGLLGRPLRSATIDNILAERSRWKVAAMALTYRLNELGFLSEWEYRNHCIELSRRGFRRSEPGGMPHESSILLTKVLQSLREKGLRVRDLAGELGLSVHELSNYLLGLVIFPVEEIGGLHSSTDEHMCTSSKTRHLRAL